MKVELPANKKVVHLSTAHSIDNARLFVKECRTLARAGYAVTLVTPHHRDAVVDGVQVKAIPRASRRIERMTVSAARVYREALKLDADLYHFHMVELITVGLLLKARGKQVIYDIYEDMPRDLLTKSYLSGYIRQLISRLLERLENFAASQFSALVAATPAIGKRFCPLNPHTVVVNNYPLRDEFQQPPDIEWAARDQSVAYIGAISEKRGIAQMVQAMDYLPAKLGATLELAGSPEPEAYVRKLSGWARVNEHGVLSRTDVTRLLTRVRAGLVLYHPEPAYVVAQPNKFFEYMSAGVPVIASDFPLWREQVGAAGCGLLVNPLDARAIGDAIEFILTNPAEAEAMGRRGREAVEKCYNWEMDAAKLLQLYSDLLGTGEKQCRQCL